MAATTRFVVIVTWLLGSASSAGAQEFVQTPSIFEPVSTPAEAIFELSTLVFGITGGIFVVVFGILTYSVVRFRARPGDAGHEPPQVYGSTPIELAWTVLPLLIVFVLFLITFRDIAALEKKEPPPGSVVVTVVGHQWWWEYRYDDLGIITANELHIPVSDPANPTPTFFKLESQDVIHSFWVPRLGGKIDVIPNRRNFLWFEPRKEGMYVGQCAEYCGTQHANMRIRVYVHSQADFQKWVADQRKPAAENPAVKEGRDLFLSTSCINCHRVDGTVADGRFGPDLTHLMSRDTIGSCVAPNTPENLRAWVKDPDTLKPGCLMPDMKLTASELDKVVAYLLTLE